MGQFIFLYLQEISSVLLIAHLLLPGTMGTLAVGIEGNHEHYYNFLTKEVFKGDDLYCEIDLKELEIRKSGVDSDCDKLTTHFAKPGTFIPRALVSYPGSGNTWLRHLIESSTGFYTGSVLNYKPLFNSGFLGEMRRVDDGTTIVQKTHHHNFKKALPSEIFQYRGILIIRNPFDAITANWNLMRSENKNKTGYADESTYSTLRWKRFVEKGATFWANVIEVWIGKSKDLHIVKYEDMKSNPEREILRILQYLQQPVDHKRIKCTLQNIEGRFHRKEIHSAQEKMLRFTQHTDVSGKFTLDAIVLKNIMKVNTFLSRRRFPLQFNYNSIS